MSTLAFKFKLWQCQRSTWLIKQECEFTKRGVCAIMSCSQFAQKRLLFAFHLKAWSPPSLYANESFTFHCWPPVEKTSHLQHKRHSTVWPFVIRTGTKAKMPFAVLFHLLLRMTVVLSARLIALTSCEYLKHTHTHTHTYFCNVLFNFHSVNTNAWRPWWER